MTTFIFVLFLATSAIADSLYAPLAPAHSLVTSRDITITFTPKNRPLDLRVTWPLGARKLPVVIWSHGAFGSRDGYQPLALWWAQHGYVVIQPTHQDSVQKGTLPLLSSPATFREWDVRPQEISFIMDHLGDIVTQIPETGAAMDQEKIAVGGHSFGAHTALLVAGMTVKEMLGGRRSFVDARPLAFVMISPQGIGGNIDEDSFAHLDRPALFVTGGKDALRTGESYESRLDAFNRAPPENKYLLFIDGAMHNFGGISGARFPGAGPDDPAQVDEVKSATLAFFDAYLKKDTGAKAYLAAGAPKNGARIVTRNDGEVFKP